MDEEDSRNRKRVRMSRKKNEKSAMPEREELEVTADDPTVQRLAKKYRTRVEEGSVGLSEGSDFCYSPEPYIPHYIRFAALALAVRGLASASLRVSYPGGTEFASGTTVLAKALAKSATLTRLELSGNRICAEGAAAVAAAAQAAPLVELDLSWNRFGAEGARAVAAALGASRLRLLALCGNGVGDEGTAALAAALAGGAALTDLRLDSCGVGDDGARALAAALPASRLARLDLQRNGIGPDGVAAIAAALRSNCALRTLALDENAFSDDGARALAAALHENRVLHALSLAGNEFSRSASGCLGRAVAANRGLRLLDLRACAYDSTLYSATADALEENRRLLSVRLVDGQTDGAGRVSRAIKHNRALWARNIAAREFLESDEALETTPLLRDLYRIVADYVTFSPAGEAPPWEAWEEARKQR